MKNDRYYFLAEKNANKIITEECGIADKVSDISRNLFDTLTNQCTKAKLISIDDGVSKAALSSTETFDINGKLSVTFMISAKYFAFKDNAKYEEFTKNNDITADATSTISSFGKGKCTCFLFLSIIRVGKRFDRQLIDSIQHEVNHIYQQCVSGKEYPNAFFYNYFYNKMRSSDNINERIVGLLLYLSDSGEQDSLINGLYAQCEKYHKEEHVSLIISNSLVVRRLVEFEKYLQYVIDNKEQFYPIIRRYNKEFRRFKQFSNFVRYLKSRLKRFYRKFARINIKIKNDFIIMNESVWFSGNYLILYLL